MTDDTTETTDETTTDAAEPVESEATETAAETTPAAPASSGSTGGGNVAQAAVSETPVDIDAELSAKEILVDKFAAGLLSAEDYAKETAKHDKAIIKAQRELAKPAQQVQQTIKAQEAAKSYWQQWGKGADVAQMTFGKTVKADRANALYREALAEVQANPRYQNRKELDAETIAYDKWMDKLEAEAKKKPGTAATASTPQTRVSGDRSVAQTGQTSGVRKTARQKLDDGDYNLEG